MKHDRITVVICVYNREKTIQQCLESVLAQRYEGLDIVVVDDGSTDRTAEIAEQFVKNDKVRVCHNGGNRGLCASRNRGASLAASGIIAFLDSDCIAQPNWLRELIRPFAECDDIVIVGGKILDPDPKSYWGHATKGINFTAHKSGYVEKITGANMAIRKDFLSKNQFDEQLPYSADETDLCHRALKQGRKIYFQDTAEVTHFHRNSLGPLLKQRFLIGVGNYLERRKHGIFPFASVKGIILLSGCFLLGLSMAGLVTPVAPAPFFIVYAARVLYEDYRPRRKGISELIVCFPGKALLTATEDLGQLCGILLICFSR